MNFSKNFLLPFLNYLNTAHFLVFEDFFKLIFSFDSYCSCAKWSGWDFHYCAQFCRKQDFCTIFEIFKIWYKFVRWSAVCAGVTARPSVIPWSKAQSVGMIMLCWWCTTVVCFERYWGYNIGCSKFRNRHFENRP